MRTLLDESLPPQCGESMFPHAQPLKKLARTFSQNAVLSKQAKLTEVGAVGTNVITPGASHSLPGHDALDRDFLGGLAGSVSTAADHSAP